MPKNERGYQNYFMKIAKPLNYHRTALANGSGFPDVLGFHGPRHSLVELKDLILGKRGDRLLKQDFELSQPPWFAEYFAKGGCRLFVSFRIRDWDESNKRYGLLQLNKDLVMRLASNTLKYSNLLDNKFVSYKEYQYCKEMIEDIETWGDAR